MSSSATSTQFSKEDLLLFHGMMLVAHPTGVVDESGLTTLERFCNTLPEFRDRDFDELLRSASALQAEHPSLADSAKELTSLVDSAVRVKLFVLAVDLAMSSGTGTEATAAVLESLIELLKIDEETAVQVVAVLNLKYRR